MTMERTQKHRPICLNFCEGSISSEVADNARCKMMAEILCPTNVTKIIMGMDENLYKGDVTTAKVCENFVALRNKRTNSIRFFPMDIAFMCPDRKLQQSSIKVELKSAAESLTHLNRSVGSKKAKRKLMTREKNAARLPDFNETLEQTSEMINSENSPSVELNRYLPPCNRKAISVEQAYKIQDLVSEEILDTLDSIAKEILEKDLISWASETRFSPFIMKAVVHVSKDLLKFKLLLFVDQLLALLKNPRQINTKSNALCSFSAAVNKKLIEEFTVPAAGNKRRRTDHMNDKILCYALVLIMLCCNYEIDIGLLAGIVTPAEHNRLPALLKILGAKSNRTVPSIFKLSVPIAESNPLKRRSIKRLASSRK